MPEAWRAALRHPARSGRSRPVGLLLGLLAAQAAFAWIVPRHWQAESSPGDAPPAAVARVLALGESRAAAYAMTLYVQGFDIQAGQPLAIRSLASAAIRSWLERAMELDPDSGYPLLLASRIYAEASHPDDARAMLRLVMRRFEASPATRWPWQVHGLYVARHVMNDRSLAAELARSLREHGNDPAIPVWARQAEILLVADIDGAEAARALLGALVQSGAVTDRAELAFLMSKLDALDARIARRPGAPAAGRQTADPSVTAWRQTE